MATHGRLLTFIQQAALGHREPNCPAGSHSCTGPVGDRPEDAVIDAILNNHLLFSAILLVLLLLVPALFACSYDLRDPARPDRRKQPRSGADRRA